MNLFSTVIKKTLFIILYISIFFLSCAIIANYNEPDFKKIDNKNLPTHFPIATYWETETGEKQCRAFWAYQLKELDNVITNYRFNIPASAQDICNESTKYLKEKQHWPITFDWERKITWPYASITIEKNNIVVSYTPDDDLFNKSRYSANDKEIMSAEYKTFSGPTIALKAMPYGFLATAGFWLLLRLGMQFYKSRLKTD